jgi:hypothetical protein
MEKLSPQPVVIEGKPMPINSLLIAVDFDGTCVAHAYPAIGRDIGAVPVLKKIVASGHTLVLFTMRSNRQYNDLTEAINWFSANGIKLYCVNKAPNQDEWTDSPKAFAHLYIDDVALGCPLKTDFRISPRPFVDWEKVEQILTEIGVIHA